ncbi:cytochrome b [Paracoccus aestuariivivens]|uniref:Cytochrome b n=1 Tax=Paracoccus aestuariivivens TaxID=1820333 RepID=A0A6L6J401_9RHOB|nr:cytochrome b/b6 domain-containing protein [Paracoccus aestuariivivens]MTH76843.1 cytochrome b [Paracoccus aestuariivivens]
MPDRQAGYRTPARMFHWGIAIAVLLMIPAGLTMTREGLPRGLQDALFLFHKNLGVLLVPFILARLIYRTIHPPPPLPETMPQWQIRVARISHALLYALLIVMPLSGFTRVRAGGFPVELLDRLGFGPWIAKSETLAAAAQALHFLAAYLLIALLALHVAAALHHALIRRDEVWTRMWPPRQG